MDERLFHKVIFLQRHGQFHSCASETDVDVTLHCRLMTSTDKIMDVLEEKNEIVDKEDAEELLNCRGEIEFDNGRLLA